MLVAFEVRDESFRLVQVGLPPDLPCWATAHGILLRAFSHSLFADVEHHEVCK